MLRLLPLVLLFGCDGTAQILGGQEGEPVALPPQPELQDLEDGFNVECGPTIRCEGPGWCADYAGSVAPADLELQCAEAGGQVFSGGCTEQPDFEDAVGFCSDLPCASVWLFDDLQAEPAAFCDDLGLSYVTSRG